MSVYFRQHQVETAFSNGSESWVVLSQIEKQIKEKIEKVGTPLKDWDIQINYGIKTGFNEAFIIDGKKRQELIEQDPKSDEIIRPILRGRDIKRYSYDFADLYLITTFPSLKIDIEQYPAVKQHLLSFGYDRLKQTGDKGSRKKTNNKWFETQDSISYWEDFYKQKIIYSELTQGSCFILDNSNKLFTLQTGYIIVGDNLNFLLTFLNSKLLEWAFRRYYSIELGGSGLRWLKQYVEILPIPKNHIKENDLETFLQSKEYDKIDKLIYSIYGLTEEEINFIENREC